MKDVHVKRAICTSRTRVSRSALVILAITLLVVSFPATLFADAATWVDGDAPVLKVNQQISNSLERIDCFHTTFTYHSYTKPNGSYDSIGRDVDTPVCATQNQLGFYGGSGFTDDYSYVRPNTSHAFPVLNPRGDSLSVTPVPNQAIFFTKDSSQNAHGDFAPHFYDSLSSSGTFGPVSQELALTINKPGAILTDNSGTKIYMHAYAFSGNGRWMVIEAAGLGLIRVDTQTRSMQLFDPLQLSYSLGFTPYMTLAISDDGNTVIKSGVDASDTYVYDLSGCIMGSFTIGASNTSAMQGCRRRVLQKSISSQLSGFEYMAAMHFSPDGESITAAAERLGVLGVREYFQVTLSVAGYQPSPTGYVALGDSFSSGEGAYDYVLGTNEPENTCHLSQNSYPYLAAEALGLMDNFHSVACSGAESTNYDNFQFRNGFIQDPSRNRLGLWQPGYKGQQNYLGQAGSVSVATISMIGNDIGFGDILTGCLLNADPCYHFKEDRQNLAQSIQDKFGTLIVLYKNIKRDMNNPNAKVYVLGYPQIMGDGPSCDLNTPFSQEERQMARGLTVYLNSVIEAATKVAGVQYVDVTDAFEGHENCQPGTKAVNGLSIDKDTPVNGLQNIATVTHSSFHPSVLGHQLLAEQLLRQSSNFTRSMPAPDLTLQAPFIGSPEYDAFIGDAPSGSTITRIVYNGSGFVQTIQKSSPFTASTPAGISLLPDSPYEVYFHSAPTFAGTLTTDANGVLQGQVTIPMSVGPGFHTVHILGKDIGGESIDLYQTVYVAASADDANGNGVIDTQEQCVLVPPSGIDQDRDGVDDACDSEISLPPSDTIPPVVTGVPDRNPDHNGWYNHDLTINWAAADPSPSSGAATQPVPTVASEDGEHTYTSEPSCDPTGNCATGSLVLQIDKTAPGITFTIAPEPNGNGWNNAATTVHFICSDMVSGVASCTDPVTISGDSGSYIVTGTAVDNAGNTSSVNAIVAIDAGAPVVTNEISPVPNLNGWNNTSVMVTPSCSDDLSGIATCAPPVTVTSEGRDQRVAGYATDQAGNTASISTAINIDKTAPAVKALQWSANPKATTGEATLDVLASDNLSGVTAAEYYLGDNDPGLGGGAVLQKSGSGFTTTFGTDFPTGVYKVSVRVRDAAGNWSPDMSDYLVVYNPFSVRMTGHHFVRPSIADGDGLPGLSSSSQTDDAKFGFSAGYDARSRMLPNNDFQFSYSTGSNCNKPDLAQNCHSLSLNGASIAWFTTQGVDNYKGVFAGSATLVIDGAKQQVEFLLSGIDGERFGDLASDHVTLQIYAAGANLSTDTPMYQVSDDVVRGNIHINI